MLRKAQAILSFGFICASVIGAAPRLGLAASDAKRATPQPYNEVYDAEGKYRPAYQRFLNDTDVDPMKPSQRMIVEWMFGHPLGDRIQALPFALMLEQQHYQQVIQPGIAQIARTLYLFFEDMVLGSQRAITAGVIPRTVVEDAFRYNGWQLDALRDLWTGKTSEDIRFLMGADLARDPQGDWHPYELNVGNQLGGLGDVHNLGTAYLDALGVSSDLHSGDAVHDFVELTEGFVHRRFGRLNFDLRKERTLALIPGLGERLAEDDDHEDQRIRNLLGEDTPAYNPRDPDKNKLLREHLRSSQLKAILNFGDFETVQRIELWRDLFQRRGVLFMVSPGTSALSSKRFLPFLDALTRFYQTQEPILRSLKSHIVTDYRLPEDYKNWVLKKADAARGEGVFVLAHLSDIEFSQLYGDLRSIGDEEKFAPHIQPTFILQERLAPSIIPTPLLDYNVQIRPIASVDGAHVYVQRIPWANAAMTASKMTNNVSAGAYELPVSIENCDQLLK